jgi:hypothetical protein
MAEMILKEHSAWKGKGGSHKSSRDIHWLISQKPRRFKERRKWSV